MAIKVPIYEQQVRPALPAIAPPGEDLFLAQRQLGNTIQGLGELMQQRALELQEEKDTQQVSEMLTNFRKDLDAIEFSKEVDADGKPAGIMERTLNHADGATIEYDRRVEEKKREYLSRLPGENQRLQFERLAQNHYLARRDNVIKHETNQRRAARAKTLEDSFNQNMAELLRNPTLENLVRLGADYTAQLDVFMVQDGYDEKSRDLKKRQVLGQLAEAAIKKALEVNNDTAAAQKIREEFKEALATLPPEEAVKLEASIQDAAFAETMENEWAKKYSGKDFLLSDGSPDYDKIQEDLRKTYTGEQFEKAWKYQSGKAGEAYKILINERNGQFREFTNTVIGLHEQGGKDAYAKAIKKARETGHDPTEVRARVEYVNQLFGINPGGAISEKQGLVNYLPLWRDIKLGKGNLEAINAAIADQKITWNQYDSLFKLYFNELLNPSNPYMLSVKGMLDNLAEAKFGNALMPGTQLKYKDVFEYEITRLIPGKKPDEVYAAGIELLKQAQTGKTIILGNPKFQQYQFEVLFKQQAVEALRTDAGTASQKWQAFYNALGKDIVLNIGTQILGTDTRKDWNAGDVERFIRNIGGKVQYNKGQYEVILSHKQRWAINTLISKGYPVTEGNVKQILAQSGDGKKR